MATAMPTEAEPWQQKVTLLPAPAGCGLYPPMGVLRQLNPRRKQRPRTLRVPSRLPTALLACLEHQVERRLGGAAELREARLREDMPQSAFAGLRTQSQLDFL
jgi:hypothetical protein